VGKPISATKFLYRGSLRKPRINFKPNCLIWKTGDPENQRDSLGKNPVAGDVRDRNLVNIAAL
jgi:hypothetical protein